MTCFARPLFSYTELFHISYSRFTFLVILLFLRSICGLPRATPHTLVLLTRSEYRLGILFERKDFGARITSYQLFTCHWFLGNNHKYDNSLKLVPSNFFSAVSVNVLSLVISRFLEEPNLWPSLEALSTSSLLLEDSLNRSAPEKPCCKSVNFES